jgi:hypothetical protein
VSDVNTVIEGIKRKSTLAKWGLGLLGVVLLAPLSFALAYAIFGAALLGLALAFAGVVGLTVLAGVPWLVTKLANKRIEWVLAEARRSPIPTLWEGHRQDAEDLRAMGEAITEYATEIGNAQDKARKLAKDLLPEDLASFNKDVQAMQVDLELQEQDYREAVLAHEKQEAEIKRASAIWDLNMAVANANAKNLNSRAEDTLAKIKRETALDSVSASMNRSKAQLRQRIQQRSAIHGAATAALANNPSQVIDLAPQALKVQR